MCLPQELLGDRLVTSPVSDGELHLPSPNQLRYKIILKNKKLRQTINNNNANTILSSSSRGLNRNMTIDDPTGGGGANEDDDDSDFDEDDYENDIQGTPALYSLAESFKEKDLNALWRNATCLIS